MTVFNSRLLCGPDTRPSAFLGHQADVSREVCPPAADTPWVHTEIPSAHT